jgi:hypothetical protein
MLCFKEATIASKTFLNEQDIKIPTAESRCCASLLVMPSSAQRQTPPSTSVEVGKIASNIKFIDRLMYSLPFDITALTRHKEDSKYKENQIVDEQLLFSQLSISLIFNLALTHHTMAVVMMTAASETHPTSTIASASRDMLFKACGLYSVAYSLPQNEPYLHMIWPGMLSLFVKAILNNLGHCYASLDDNKTSVQCFELLLTNIMLYQQDHIYPRLCVEDGIRDRYHNDATMCFCNSTMFLILKNPGFASAA